MEQISRIDELIRQQREQGQLLMMVKTMETSMVLRRELFGETSGEVQHLGELLVREYNAVAMECLRAEMFEDVTELLKKAFVMTEPDTFFTDAATRLRLRAITHNNLGCSHKRRGKLSTAVKHLEKAVRIELSTEAPDNPAGTHLNLCAVLSLCGQHDRALHHAHTALALLEHHEKEAAAEGQQGAVAREQAWGSWEELCAARVDPAPSKRSGTRAVLTQAIFERLSDRVTRLGGSLSQCIAVDVLCPEGEHPGAMAADPQCYSLFSDFFDPLIQRCCQGYPSAAAHPTRLDGTELLQAASSALDPTKVVGCTVVLARNLKDLPFSPGLTPDERAALQQRCQEALGGEWRALQEASAQLVGTGLDQSPSPELIAAGCAGEWPQHRSVGLCNSVAVAVGLTEHLTFVAQGRELAGAFREAVGASQAAEGLLGGFAKSGHLGFLTADLHSLGSAMRASVTLNLPSLAAQPDTLATLSEALAVVAQASGDQIRLHNAECLGKDEHEQLATVLSAASAFIQADKTLQDGQEVKPPKPVVRGVPQAPAETNSGTMLPVAYHNIAAELEHLQRFDEAVAAFRTAASLAKTRLGVHSEVTLAMQSSLQGCKRAKKAAAHAPTTARQVPSTARPWIPNNKVPRTNKVPKQPSGALTARRHTEKGRQAGTAYETRPRLSPRRAAPATLPSLPSPSIEQYEHALARKREDWERLPWNHVPMSHAGAGIPSEGRFQPPVAQPSLATLYSAQKMSASEFVRPAPPPALPPGTLYRPARRAPASPMD